jgi:predicted ArsR family transcriptional regulator
VKDRFAVAAALADRSRRALYEYVRRQNRSVGREEAAEATGMSRGLAAFHLDKLVDAGLLTARYEAPADQPRGRGRAPKVYEAAGDGLAINIPERRYDLIAEILADAVAEDPTAARDAAMRVATRRGREIGAVAHEDAGPAPADAGAPGEAASTSPGEVEAALSHLGFEPERDAAGVVRLHNCPFHVLASRHTELICGLNQCFITGLIEGLSATGVEARLAPRPGECCVELRER